MTCMSRNLSAFWGKVLGHERRRTTQNPQNSRSLVVLCGCCGFCVDRRIGADARRRRVALLRRRPAQPSLLTAAQVAAANFNALEVAWRFKTDSLGPRPEYKLEGTPLVVNGVLYTTAGTRRAVVALDAATGELRWAHSEREGARAAASPRQPSGRGAAAPARSARRRGFYV